MMKKGIVGISLFVFCLFFSVNTIQAQDSAKAVVEKVLPKATELAEKGTATPSIKSIDQRKPNINIKPEGKVDRAAAIARLKNGEGIKFERPTRSGEKIKN